ncbi:peptidylprolyl isomerase [Mycoplasma sp. P36-A1]|uniref:peptidylprolyl isomerase n=1 Tax=Mycoplasma sp. P36-A1 TaxID=3252900 RepID=UPI003C2FE5D6
MTLKNKVTLGLVIASLATGVIYAQNDTTITDGDKEVLTVNGNKKTSLDLYNAIELNAGFTPALEVLDTKVLEQIYKDDSRLAAVVNDKYKEAEETAKSSDSTMAKEYEIYSATNKDEYIKNSGIRLAALRKLAAIDQAEKAIFSKAQMQYVYDNYFSGTGEIFNILISPAVSAADYGNEETISKAKAEALKTAEQVISEINAGTISFQDAVKKYSSNKINDNGSLGKYNVNSAREAGLNKGIINAAFSLEDGKASKVIATENGYEIVMIKYSEAKKTYEELEKQVASKLYDIYSTENTNVEKYVLDLFRSDNKISFNDNAYSKEYASSVIDNRVNYQQFDPNNASSGYDFGY